MESTQKEMLEKEENKLFLTSSLCLLCLRKLNYSRRKMITIKWRKILLSNVYNLIDKRLLKIPEISSSL